MPIPDMKSVSIGRETLLCCFLKYHFEPNPTIAPEKNYSNAQAKVLVPQWNYDFTHTKKPFCLEW